MKYKKKSTVRQQILETFIPSSSASNYESHKFSLPNTQTETPIAYCITSVGIKPLKTLIFSVLFQEIKAILIPFKIHLRHSIAL
jgi:hypothetical protein